MPNPPASQSPNSTNRDIVWTLAGAALVVLLPWFQRWLYVWPEMDYRLFLRGDFLELTAQRAFFYRSLAEGKLALWDPIFSMGVPFLEYLFDLFNPLSLLSVFFLDEGLLRSDYLQKVLVAYCSLAGLGAFLLGLQLNLGRAAATVMGVVMGCMGIVTAHSDHSMMIQTFCWAPLVLLFLHRARTGLSLLNAAWAGVCLGWSFMGGIPQVFYYVGTAATLYALYAIVTEFNRGGWRPAWRLGLAPYLIMGLASAIWALPNLAHLAGTRGGDPVGVHDAEGLVGFRRRSFIAQGSGDWWMLPHFLAPQLMNRHAETTIYVGIAPLGLALVAVAWVRKNEAGFYKLLGVVGIVLMMGASMGLHKVLMTLMPGYYLFRETIRWMFLLHLALLVLAGYGLHWLLYRAQAPELGTLRRFLAVLAGIITALILLLITAEGLRLEGLAYKQLFPPLSILSWLLFCVAALWWSALRLSQGVRPRMIALLLVALAALDLGFYYAPRYMSVMPVKAGDPTKPNPAAQAAAARLVGLAGGPEGGRVLAFRERDTLGYQYPAYVAHLNFINPPGGYMNRRLPLGFWQMWWEPQANPRYLQIWAVKLVDQRSPVVNARRSDWALCGYSQSAVRLNRPMEVKELKLKAKALLPGQAKPGELVARMALTLDGKITAQWPLRQAKEVAGKTLTLEAPPDTKADAVLMASAHPVALVGISGLTLDGQPLSDHTWLKPGPKGYLVNQVFLGRAWFVSRASVVEPDWEYKQVLASVDPSRSVVLRKRPAGWRAPKGVDADSGGTVKMLSWQDQNIELQVEASRPGWVVLSQSAYHGWRATLDGKDTPIDWAYGFMTTVAVPQGKHKIRLVYSEPWVEASLGAQPLLILVLLAVWLWTRRRDKRPPAQ
ncbi:MAG: YfhO family protein [Deltaproteobacteria bacterium]|nr:YfhO family protein [Deltaproteobacteria bacterium]